MKWAWAANSLAGRISRLLALQTAVGISLVCASVYIVTAWTVSTRQDEMLAKKMTAVEAILKDSSGSHRLSELRHRLGDFLAGHDEISLWVHDAAGSTLYQNLQKAGERSPTLKTVSLEVSHKGFTGGAAVAFLAYDAAGDNAMLAKLAWTLALAACGGALLLTLGGFWVVSIGLGPIRQVVMQTRMLSPQRLNPPLNCGGQVKELEPLILHINELLRELSAAYRQMESFNADVAHELNTPLTTLINSCELALRRPRTDAELREVIASNLEEHHRLAGIVSDMLFLAHASTGAAVRLRAPASLAEQARQVARYLEPRAAEHGHKIEIQGDAVVAVDAPLIRRALTNLIDNAIRYAVPATNIKIQIFRGATGAAEIQVVNRGATLSEEKIARMFDRFYRADSSRSFLQGTHGLGLSIVESIARMHHGRVFASSSDNVTQVGFSLPDQSLSVTQRKPSSTIESK